MSLPFTKVSSPVIMRFSMSGLSNPSGNVYIVLVTWYCVCWKFSSFWINYTAARFIFETHWRLFRIVHKKSYFFSNISICDFCYHAHLFIFLSEMDVLGHLDLPWSSTSSLSCWKRLYHSWTRGCDILLLKAFFNILKTLLLHNSVLHSVLDRLSDPTFSHTKNQNTSCPFDHQMKTKLWNCLWTRY